ncbi:MAG: prolipoprotein diacylglyceryl transferase [Clostridia bacterium]|jgi:phosphatidylglycerol:prolipoprotein diacylglycerol transferase|nr:prolipoprotein diacylglyceryl transferase [Clostridia bacterium]MCI2001212.1 prolipoprotein diacylglyceryl transferase [Clostridia bacterium]MCI2015920.1 prolipoprotein diacylglyceryl transferase [Clostridia bacterium]
MPEIWFPNIGIKIYHLSRVLFSIGNFNIYWYGAIIGIGIVLATLLVLHEAERSGQKKEDYIDLASFGIIASVIGARLYYVIFSWDNYKTDLLKIFAIREGGLAIYGGVLTGIVCGIIFSKRRKIPFWLVADTVLPSVLLGQILGRWGNFFNREAFGGYTNGLFAMRYLKNQVANIAPSVLAHVITVNGTEYIQVQPTFLYESFPNLCLFIFLIILRKHKKFDGQIGTLYMIGYGIIRFFVEGLRTDQLKLFDTGIAVSQVVSIVLIIVGIAFYIILMKRSTKIAGAANENK